MRFKLRILELLSCCSMLLMMACADSFAATPITYSWSGFLSTTGEEDDPDPWALGPTDIPFTLVATIPDLSAPIMSRQIGFATFDLSEFRLTINELEISLEGYGGITFTDYDLIFDGQYAVLPDSIGVLALVSYSGTEMIFSSTQSLPGELFSFPTEFSLPPVFAPTTAIENGSSSLWRANNLGGFQPVYFGLGTSLAVTSTLAPEPSTLLLGLASLLLWRWRKSGN